MGKAEINICFPNFRFQLLIFDRCHGEKQKTEINFRFQLLNIAIGMQPANITRL